MERILPKSLVEDLVPFVTGDMFYADSTTTLAKLPIGSETQVLNVATAIPTWTSTITLTGLTVKDNTFNIVGNVDDTKRLRFEVDDQTAGARLNINTGAQTVDRTLTVPVLTGNATLMTLEETQTVTGAKTFSNASGVVVSAATGTTLTVSSTTDATSSTAASVTLAGGLAVAKGQYIGTFLNVGTTVTASPDTDTAHILGRARMGYAASGAADYAYWSHYDAFTNTNYALAQGSGGDTYLNSKGGTILGISIGNSQRVAISATTNTFASNNTTSFANTTDSTSISTGSIVTSGGIGVAKRLTLDGATGKTLRIVNGVANAAVATTLGSVGPTGSTAGDPQGWMRVDINGTDRYIPYW